MMDYLFTRPLTKDELEEESGAFWAYKVNLYGWVHQIEDRIDLLSRLEEALDEQVGPRDHFGRDQVGDFALAFCVTPGAFVACDVVYCADSLKVYFPLWYLDKGVDLSDFPDVVFFCGEKEPFMLIVSDYAEIYGQVLHNFFENVPGYEKAALYRTDNNQALPAISVGRDEFMKIKPDSVSGVHQKGMSKLTPFTEDKLETIKERLLQVESGKTKKNVKPYFIKSLLDIMPDPSTVKAAAR